MDFLIRDIPEHLHTGLREQTVTNNRTMNDEVKIRLARSFAPTTLNSVLGELQSSRLEVASYKKAYTDIRTVLDRVLCNEQ
jgi:hypothetical protein